jgi:ketosteroid isomerase-like protein
MKTFRPPLPAAALVSVLLAACSQPPAGPTFGPGDEAAIRTTTEAALAIANSSKDWDAYVEVYYAPDATVLPPNAEAVHGRAAMAAFLATFPTITRFTAEMVTVEGTGDLAYVHGTYHLEMSTPEGPASDDGKYIEIWKRQDDGGWKITYDIFNSNLPAM